MPDPSQGTGPCGRSEGHEHPAAQGRQRPAVETHDFQLRVESHDATTLIAGSGEVDIATVPPLRAALAEAAEAESPRLIVDLTDVTFIDCVGVGAILHAKRRAGAEGRMAVVVPEPPTPA